MKIYVGGAHQGQLELARLENPGAELIDRFHERIKVLVERREDVSAYVELLMIEHSDAVIISDELGAGIVPMEPIDRAWREAHGRAMCLLTRQAEALTRVVCGIGVRLK